MKRKKSIFLSIVLSIVLIVTSVLSVLALANPTVYVDYDDNLVAGQTVSIPVLIKNNSGLMGFRINIDYDASVLTSQSVSYGNVVQGGLQDNIEGDAEKGSFCVYWAGSENNSNNGTLFYVNFEVDENAVSTTNIDLSYSQSDTFDEDFNDVVLDCESKSLDITNTSITSYAKLKATANDAVAGENVILKISPEDIKNISTANLKIKYDNKNISYVSSTNSTVSVEDGMLNVAIPNVAKTVQLTFKSSDTASQGEYQFEIISNEKNVICNNCEFNISPSQTSEVAKVTATDVYFEQGEKIRIPIKIENNKGIMGYRLTFEYNTELLSNPVVENSNKFEGSLNDSIGVKDGIFDVLWNSSGDVVKDDVLFYLTFDYLKSGTSTINVSYNQADTFNEKYEDVVFDCINGNVSVCEGHYYNYVGDLNSYNMQYVCANCNKHASFEADEICDVWWSKQFINTVPTNESSRIDINGDKIINCKDYAMIIQMQLRK